MIKRERSQKWKKFPPPYEVGKDGFTYKDLPKDKEGWVDTHIYRPMPYDLVEIQTQKKIKHGWWDGQKWIGHRLREHDELLYWKQTPWE